MCFSRYVCKSGTMKKDQHYIENLKQFMYIIWALKYVLLAFHNFLNQGFTWRGGTMYSLIPILCIYLCKIDYYTSISKHNLHTDYISVYKCTLIITNTIKCVTSKLHTYRQFIITSTIRTIHKHLIDYAPI